MNNQGIVITQTPFRLSFFGGGTDFPGYFNQHGGAVLAAAIDKYLYVTINSLQRFYEKRIRLSYSKLEVVNALDELQHGIVRTVLEHHPHFMDDSFIDMHSYADFPASCGMGSSSAFTVGFLTALYSLNGIYKSPEDIAYEAIDIERVKLKDAGGWQDQVVSAMGGFSVVHFRDNHFRVEPVTMSPGKMEALQDACLLFFTGGTRSSSEIQKNTFGQVASDKTEQLNALQKTVAAGVEILHLSTSSAEMLCEFGALLDKSWQAKKELSSHISNKSIDQMYAAACKAGALGGKLCGAGGEGFLLVIVPTDKRSDVIQALSAYRHVKVRFNDFGSKIIYSKIIS